MPKRRKRDRAYPAFTGDEYDATGERVDPHTRWEAKVTVITPEEMARRADVNKRRELPPDPYNLDGTA